MKIKLTIKTDYLPDWGSYEGVRELLQNGRDAEVEMSAPCKVTHDEVSKRLFIENTGCVLPHEALLFGYTTKQGKSQLIGKFGEGLKLGVLALVRAGHEVKIRSGSEVWLPRLEKSEKFDSDVLVFHISENRKPNQRIRIEIGGIGKEEWELMKSNFLFLVKREQEENIVSTSNGSLLLSPEFAGKIYVKGIFVQNSPDMRFGYDFVNASVDRDRKMVSKWDSEYECKEIWARAVQKKPELLQTFVDMLGNEQSADLNGVSDYTAKYLPEEVRVKALEAFQEGYGEKAVPVSTMQESKEIEHLGRRGVVVPQKLKNVLETMLGTTDAVRKSLQRECTEKFSWYDLDTEERTNLSWATDLLQKVCNDPSLQNVNVGNFRSNEYLGLYLCGEILVSRTILRDRIQTLRVLVHEVSHSYGPDGSHQHIDAVEQLWGKLVAYLTTDS